MQIEINNKIIVAILAIVLLYLVYYYTTTYTISTINKHIEPFTDKNNNIEKAILTNIPIQQKAQNELNYNDRADVIINEYDLNNIMDDLLDNKNTGNSDVSLAGRQSKAFELITKTDQDQMFNNLEQTLLAQYEQTTTKDGFYKSIERPLQSSSLISTNEATNSSLNPVMNPSMFDDQNTKDETIWKAYDKLTSTGHVNNYDELEPKDISTQYLLGNNKQYGSTFDNYAKQ